MSAEAIAANWPAISDKAVLNTFDNALDQSLAMIEVAKPGFK
jgi:hypothetical protein